MLTKGLFSVSQNASDPDLLIVKKNNAVVGSTSIRITKVRDYLVGTDTAQYTINAAVRIARFVSAQFGLNYQVSTNLTGTVADDQLIIPDNIAIGIVLLQAFNGVSIDGVPGADFIRKVMGLYTDITIAAQCRAAFMDESDNTAAVTPGGKPIVLPDFQADENVAYDFLRDITLVRNGLWSDKPGIVNLTALRLEKGLTDIQWDDTISACWISPEGIKNAKVYTATTEPGNKTKFKTLLPQTIVFYPGYHQGKLPAMRGHRTMTFVPTNKYPDRLLFNTDDARGLNLHPGGSAGQMLNLVPATLPVDATNETEFKAVLVFMEIFEILSHWGLDPKLAAYVNLSGWAAAKALRAGTVAGGNVPVLQDETTQPVKQISVATARGWLAKKWTADRPTLIQILRSVDSAFVAPANFNTLSTTGLESVITDQHIRGIVGRQCDYFFDLKQVDGLAGNTYLSLLNAEIPADVALAKRANADFARLTNLLNQFGTSNAILTNKRKTYVKQIRTQTLIERAKLLESQAKIAMKMAMRLAGSGKSIADLVGLWSELCQVVFGPEMYYEMMRFTVGNALVTGQRRWYYTLVNQASVPK